MSQAYAWYALGVLTLINLFNFLDRNVIFAVFEPIKQELALTDAQLGWLGSAYILVFSVAALPFGALSDLRGRRLVIAGGVALWSLFTVLSGMVTGFWQLFLCRAMVGIGEAAFGAASASLVADFFPQRGRAMALGILSGGLVLGGGLGIWLGGVLGQAYGWRVAFIAVGLPGFALAALAAKLHEPEQTGGATTTDLTRELEGALRTVVLAGRTVVASRPLTFVFLGGALISFGMNGLVGWAPTFVGRELEISTKAASDLLGWRLLVFGAAGTLAGGFIADAWRRRSPDGRIFTVATGMITGAALAVWLLLLRDPAVFKPVFSLAVFFLTWYNGPLNAVIFDNAPARIESTIAGSYLLFIHLAGDAVAFPLVGWLSDRVGIDRAILTLPAVAFLGGILVLFARQRAAAPRVR
ncbi:MAG: MFS transporter [Gemmatimonadales bacterium]|nr:MFS transporter [Gemmatimonadales bacterium]